MPMKQRKSSFEESAGLVIGGLVYFFVYLFNIDDLLIAFPVLFTYQTGYSQIGYWIKCGPMFLFFHTFSYLAARKVIDEKTKKEYLFLITCNLIALILWLIIMTVAYSFNFKIDDTTNIVGGYVTILLVIFLMDAKQRMHCEFT
nr:hypothetical protein [uncultured Methanolobus sp.]